MGQNNTWNPAQLNQRINELEAKVKAADVEANPAGEATGTLSTIGIEGSVYTVNEKDLNISDKFVLNTATYSSLTGTVNAFYDKKTNKVYGSFGARATEAIPTTAEYFTIDSAYRPTATTNIPALIIISQNNVPTIYTVIIGTDGSIKQDLSGDSRGIYAYFEYYI